MIKKWIENLTFTPSNDDQDVRRKHARRSSESAIATIDGKSFGVENWSEGGVLLNGDDKTFGVDQTLNMIMKFKLDDRVLEVEQDGRIVRKNNNKFAVQFGPLTDKAVRGFKQVIDDAVTREFAESQMA
ncbi:MAG: PilZ domain-containing protein [Pseudomonadota bacterium]